MIAQQDEGYAIVGMACRFPGHANSPQSYWRLLCDGVDATTDIPSERFDIARVFDPDPTRPGKLYARRGGFADCADRFDAAFFGISPREAAQIDPQQRMLLEVAWEALEDAGLTSGAIAGSRTGVYIGISTHDFGDALSAARARIDAHTATGIATSIAANRISYALDLRGPSVAVDTACSSSLTAVHLACLGLVSGDSDLALAGGVNLYLRPESAMTAAKAAMLAPDGRCKAFSARADGFARGEGAGIVVLKPLASALADGDRIYAVVRGSAINQDGRTTGISVPSLEAQAAMIRAALAAANLAPSDIQYIEAHGTGTPVGDPIEIGAIGSVFAPTRDADHTLVVGSAKTNIAHLEAAAGIAGLIKTALALAHRQIPPNLHFDEPNPVIPFAELKIDVPVTLRDWPATDGVARAGVNSFGFGGSNAHVILEAAPARTAMPTDPASAYLLALSAKSAEALRQRALEFAAYLDSADGDLADICYTAAQRRTHFEQRLAVVGRDRAELAAALNAYAQGEPTQDAFAARAAANAKIAFVFSGMGPQYIGMATQIAAAEPLFRAVVERCDAGLAPHAGWSVRQALSDESVAARFGAAAVSQVTNFVVQAGLIELLRSWGIAPDAVTGHSVGEIAAAYTAGVITLEDGVALAYRRGQLVQEASGRGGMMSVALGQAAIAEAIASVGDRVCIAALNSEDSTTLSGENAALVRLGGEFEARGITCRMLDVSVPYHSALLDGLDKRLKTALADFRFGAPTMPLASTTGGAWANDSMFDAAYWGRNLRDPVRFTDAVNLLVAAGCNTFIEIGPHPVLRNYLAAQVPANAAILATLRRGVDDPIALRRTAGALHALGHVLDWRELQRDGGRLVALPHYPWQREVFGTGNDFAPSAGDFAGEPSDHPLLGSRLPTARPTWRVDLSDSQLDFLADHRVTGEPVFPAAAYVEMALAAARQLGPIQPVGIEEIVFERMLPMGARREKIVEFACGTDRSFEIHSRSRSAAEWTLHARGRFAAGSQPAPAARRSREESETHTDAYPLLARFGLEYAGLFRNLHFCSMDGSGASARIVLPAPVSEGEFLVHPALLDGALQAMIVAAQVEAQDGSGLLPISVGRIDWHRLGESAAWAEIRSVHRDRDSFEGDIDLFADDGAPIMTLSSVRARRTLAAPREPLPLYRLEWIAQPRQANEGTAVRLPVVEAIELCLAERTARFVRNFDYSATIARDVNTVAARLARAALQSLGWRGGAADAARLGVVARHELFIARLVEIASSPLAARQVEPHALAEMVSAQARGWRDALSLLQKIGAALPDILTGKREAHDVLFANDAALDALANFYAGANYYPGALGAVLALAAAEPRQSKLRVLEIGAGTGATSECLLDGLAPGAVDYTFTDVSSFFLAHGRRRLAGREGVHFEILDIERPVPEGQPYDVIVVANVIHATPDIATTLAHIRQLLAPGGLFLMLELVLPEYWLDTVFGVFEGWWRFADAPLRTAHPLLPAERWNSLLEAHGFDGIVRVPDLEGIADPFVAGFVARASNAHEQPRCLIVHDEAADAAQQLAAALTKRGHTCTLVSIQAAVAAIGAVNATWDVLVDVAAARSSDATDALLEAQVEALAALSERVRAAAAAKTPPRNWWIVTFGSQAVGQTPEPQLGCHATVWAAGRSMITELPNLHCRLADLSFAFSPADIALLATEIAVPDEEAEVAFRGGARYVPRVRALPYEDLDGEREVSVECGEVKLESPRPGVLDALALHAVRRAPLRPDQLLVRVEAVGLNFRDVMLALGLLRWPDPDLGGDPHQQFGFECAGVVEAVGAAVERFQTGDEVFGLALGSLGSHVRMEEAFTLPRPPALEMADLATVPVAFATAHYALNRIARIAANDRVLVHAASGGVGLAAIQLCRNAGAEIFATAGSPAKRAYLESLGVAHVYDSRTLNFATAIRGVTGGEGVDVVLNSLAGEALTRGLGLLRPFGRFVEIGKSDLLANSSIGLAPFAHNLTFASVDLHLMKRRRPNEIAEIQKEVVGQLERGEIAPLPRVEFSLADAAAAFRHMAQARHIGKVVLLNDRPSYGARRSRVQPLFRSDATYLVTGGLGGFGLATARWLLANGAQHVVLTGRRGTPSEANRAAFEALLATGSDVRVHAADVADENAVQRLIAEIQSTLPPLRGVFHGAMVNDNRWLAQLDRASWRTVLAPKIAGAWNLHKHTRDLDVFVLYSSSASTIGTFGLANYNAANAFLDALALERHRLGLPALAVAWGAIAEVGIVAEHPEVQEHLVRLGLGLISTDDALAVLAALLRGNVDQAIAARIDWLRLATLEVGLLGRFREVVEQARASRSSPHGDHRPGALADILVARIAAVLGTTPARLDPEMPLTRAGLDSLLAVELESAIRAEFGVRVPATLLLSDATPSSLLDFVSAALGQAPVPASVVDSTPEQFPLTNGQRRIWFLQALDPDSPAYNTPVTVRLTGPLDPAAVEQAIALVVAEEEALRAGFSVTDGEPRQWIAPSSVLKFDIVDLRDSADQASARGLHERELAQWHFDLAQPPLLIARLLHLAAEEHEFILCAHHLVVDVASAQLVADRMLTHYRALVAGQSADKRTTTIRYGEYVRGQSSATDALDIDYWKRELAGVPMLSLRTDRPRQASRLFAAARSRFDLPASLLARLDVLARTEDATLFMIFLAIFDVVLAQLSGQEDFCIGAPAINRPTEGARQLVGCFVNTMALRARVVPAASFRDLLARTKQTVLGALSHQSVSWDRVVAALNPDRSSGGPPIFNSLFAMGDIVSATEQQPGLTVSAELLPTGASPFELVLQIEPRAARGLVEYSTDLYDAATIETLIANFLAVAANVADDPDAIIGGLPRLEARERERLLAWGCGARTAPTFTPVHALFEQQAARTPDAIAVQGKQSLTYGELARVVTALAADLKAKGIGPERMVGVALDRSAEAIIAMLAVLKAGGAFLPIDPAWPAARRAAVVADAKPQWLIDTVGCHDRAAGSCQPQACAAHQLAYVLYTSGTTGGPRGVMIEHAAIANQVCWRQRAFPLAASDVVLQSTALTFDPALWEIFGALANGASIVIARQPIYEGAPFNELVRKYRVTTIQLVPSALRALLDQNAFAGCTTLGRVFCGGESMDAHLAARFKEACAADLIGLYGCTETVIDATVQVFAQAASHVLPIGRPIDNVLAYIVNPCDELVPVGVPGELVIAGANVGRGYLHDAARTAARFIADPFVPGRRAFRTGDRACWLPGGDIQFLGRMDRQLKVRGCRIEPSEIEAVLRTEPTVSDAVVSTSLDSSGDARLDAWLVVAAGQSIDLALLRARVAAQLPAFMRPSSYSIVAALPRTEGGKLDAARLVRRPTRAAETPRRPLETAIGEIWQTLLGVPSIALDDDFFHLGGHSLMVVRAAARMSAALGRTISVRDVYGHPTIRELAVYLEQANSLG